MEVGRVEKGEEDSIESMKVFRNPGSKFLKASKASSVKVDTSILCYKKPINVYNKHIKISQIMEKKEN